MPTLAEDRPAPRCVHLIVRPGLPGTAGNLITAHRLATGLQAVGIPSAIRSADSLSLLPPPASAEVVHALHARWAGVPAVEWAAGRPVIWTFTGTDLEPETLPALRAALSGVSACIVFHPEAAAELEQNLPEVAGRVHIIPPGVIATTGALPGHAHAAPIFLLPAGIRAIKDPDLAVSAVTRVRQVVPDAELYITGPSRDPGFAEAFLHRLAALPFVHYLGEVPHRAMPQWYARSDVVLNTSQAEGLSNAVLEAMAFGKAVLATNVAGNRAAIRHGATGWLTSPADLPAAAVRLAVDAGLRTRLGKAAALEVRGRFSWEAEIAAHVRIYGQVLSPPGSHPSDND